MGKSDKVITAISALFIFLCINTAPAFAGDRAPVKVVNNFAKAYFMLDHSMEDYLAKKALVYDDNVSMVDFYLEKKAKEAHNQGYKITFLQKVPTHIKTKILTMYASSATVEFNATLIRSINPVYRILGSVLNIIEEYEVQDIITLVKEDGEWKVAPGAFEMPI
jgi:hypothetical protein